MITRAIETAYKKMYERNWDKIYYLVDLHETVYHNDYNEVACRLYPQAVDALKALSEFPETRIILWSSVHEEDKATYMEQLQKLGIRVDGFNVNSEVVDTKVGCFDEKTYFSVLIDDKAGFSPDMGDWALVLKTAKRMRL